MTTAPLAEAPRVAIAHDWLVRFAGSERCVTEMMAAFPGAPLLTSIVDRESVPSPLDRARPSLLQAIPGATRHHEWLVPLMPLAWRLRPEITGVDAVVSSSHACAKAVRVADGIPHLCYCHTPMRYAWDFTSEKHRFPRAVRGASRAGMGWFRRWDRITAQRVTRFAANSRAVATRIELAYGRRAQIIHPPVRTDYFTPGGVRGEDFLYVGRLVSYKRPDLVIEAFADLPHRLLVVGEGHLRRALEARATPNVVFLGPRSDDELRDLYRQARALVFPADEDFGIVMAEAQACGTPVIALARGGALDIVEPGRTGWLIDEPGVADVRRAVRAAAVVDLDPGQISARAQRFSAGRFREELRASVADMVRGAPADAAPPARSRPGGGRLLDVWPVSGRSR